MARPAHRLDGMRVWLLILALAVLPFKAVAQDRAVRLFAPEPLVASGLLDYILPRFRLKTQVQVEVVNDPAAAQMVLGEDGTPLFEGAGAVWSMQVTDQTEWTAKLADWLTGEVGRNTVTSYAPEGEALFTLPKPKEREVAAFVPDGDAALGLEVSRLKCGRCHAVEEGGALRSIGSTPSFMVMRAFPDWVDRFMGFYALNPHPAFTQIEGVSPPFDEARPSPIVPMEMTLDEVDAVLAYVAAMEAADLGAPLDFR